MKSIAIAVINGDNITTIQYYGSKLTSTQILEEDCDVISVELLSDYHEINHENDELKSLFLSWERETKLNQLGI
jgi:hypothetical protein